jgi:ADP-ribose pyrophosphatase YjhB (NUDIX family)
MAKQRPAFSNRTPEGEDRDRRVCDHCGFVDYVNPKLVAGSVVEADDGRILMCKRAIEPRRGYWTLPAGYMELGESVEDAAAREAVEEACAAIEIIDLLAIYSIPRISQVQVFFRARLASSEIAAGPESEEVALYHWDEIPMDDLAFPSVRWALEDWRARRGQTGVVPAMRTQGPDFAPY